MTTLAVEEREALITRLREFGSQQVESERLSDRGSLDRAADLMTLYEDKSWMDELPAPGRRSKVPADDFRRFTKWAVEEGRLGLARNKVTYLARTDEIHANLRAGRANVQGASAKALRPLRWLVTNDYADRMAEIWQDARQLADGDSPSEAEVKRALSDWKRRNVPKVETAGRAPRPKGIRAKVRAWEEQGRSLIMESPTEAIPILEKLLAEFDAS